MKYSSLITAALVLATHANAQLTARDLPDRADRALLGRIIRAQDSRARTDSDLTVLRTGLGAANPAIREVAVRALGRLERPDVIRDIGTALADSSLAVRLAAVQALGQAAYRIGVADARTLLLAQLEADSTQALRARIAETLGRLTPLSAAEAGNTARVITRLSYSPRDTTRDAPATTLARVSRGFFFLARRPATRGMFDGRVTSRLRQLIAYERTPTRAEVSAVQRGEIAGLAAAALIASGAATAADIETILRDPDPYVREKAAAGLQSVADTAAARRLVAIALADTAPIVRYRGVTFYARRLRQSGGCAPLVKAARDTDTHVALAAIDALGTCRGDGSAVEALDLIVASGAGTEQWHRPAHALVALATIAPDKARAVFQGFLTSKNGFVRTYAARAARPLADTTALRRLARDRDANTRSEALDGLLAMIGQYGDSLYISALQSNDAQVLMSAAKALTGNRRVDVVNALVRALARVTSLRRETSRDARLALLDAIRRNADSTFAGRVAPFLRDFDSAVATRAQEVLTSWVGNRPRTIVTPLSPQRLMPVDSLLLLADKQATIEMQDGSRIVVGLAPIHAPTNVARFVRLAQRGYFDGLTFHRVAPFYVVQGGSPRANEYVGDGPFTRDEIGLENRRGTIGVSTRGRDTGDGQIYFNLIDNVQLDPDYTVFAYVIEGMEFVDRMQEGALIRRIRVR